MDRKDLQETFHNQPAPNEESNREVIAESLDNKTEVELNENVEVSEQKNKPSVFERIISISCIAMEAIALAVLLIGVTNGFGKTLNLFQMVTFVVDIFSISGGKVYTCLAQIVIALVYIYILVKLVQNLVKQLKQIGKISKKIELNERWIVLNNLYHLTAKSISSIIFFIIFAYVLSGDSISGITIIFLIVSALLYLGVNVMVLISKNMGKLKDKNKLIEFIFAILRPISLLIVAIFLSLFILQPAGFNLSYGLQMIFGGHFGSGFAGGAETIYNFLIKDICYIINAIVFYSIVCKISIDCNINEKEKTPVNGSIKDCSITILVVTSIDAIICCILTFINSNFSSFGIESIMSVIPVLKVYFIPVIILSVVALIISKGLFEFEKEQKTN